MLKRLLLTVSAALLLPSCGYLDDGRWRAYEVATVAREEANYIRAVMRAKEIENEKPTVVVETPDGVTVSVNIAPSIRAAIAAGQCDKEPEAVKPPVGILAESVDSLGRLIESAGPWGLPWLIAREFRKSPSGVEIHSETATFDESFNTEKTTLIGENNTADESASSEENLMEPSE